MSISIATKAQDEVNFQSRKFQSLIELVKSKYVDTTNSEKLVEKAIVAVLKELDPHSVYMSKEEFRKANEPLEGSFDGIGVQFNIMNDTIMVVLPVVGGPSEKLGIQAGDKIVKVNGENATGTKITNSWVVEHLKGKKGTKVIISIARQGYKDLIDYEIIRDKIPIYSVDASFMIDDKTGYIKVVRFAASTMDEFRKGLAELKGKGVQNLILDLRGNSGGYLKTAIDLSDEFLEAGKTIVYTEGTYSPKDIERSTSTGGWEKGKLVVLIDEGSASASEIVSGAIQDWDRGLIMGRRSFGKGLVQRPFYLADGSAVRLTTARYHTPTGRCIQKPYEGNIDKYGSDLQKRFEHGEYYNQDSIKFPDSLKYYTPNKRLVYGGGGIMPDVFIPLDTTFNSKYYGELLRKGIFNQFSLKYINDNRAKMKESYPTIKDYKAKFIVDDAFMTKFYDYAESKGVKRITVTVENKKGLFRKKTIKSKDNLSKEAEVFLRLQLKSLIARDIFDSSAYFECIIEQDEFVNKALKAFDDSTFKKMKINQ